MSATTRQLKTQRDQLITAAVAANRIANANPGDEAAQHAANTAGDLAQEARRRFDQALYNR